MHLLSKQIVAKQDRSSDAPRFTLTPADLILAGKAIGITRREIDDVDYHTRLGADVASADAFLSSLAAAQPNFVSEEQASRPSEEMPVRDPGGTVVALDIDELSLVNNALNEMLHGLRAEDTDEMDDHERARARTLLEAVNAAIHDARSEARLSTTNGDRFVDFLQ